MSDFVDGIGGAVEGSLIGRAIEPEASGSASGEKAHPAEPGACLNCGVLATDSFCANCGQKTDIHRTLSAIAHDLIHGVLHLDGKLWRTLPLLTFKPGKLTRRYIEGERARFVSPMAMFLFSVFAMFAVFQMAGLSLTSLASIDPSLPVDVSAAQEEIAAELSEAREQRADMEKQIASGSAPPGMQGQLDGLDEQIAGLERGIEVVDSISQGPSVDQSEEEAISQDNEADGVSASLDVSNDAAITGVNFLDKGIINKWRENPGLMLYKLQSNGYKFSWLLIPLSVPFVWLLFAWKRRFKAYDHAVFVTYSLSFMSLLFIAISIFAMTGLSAGIIALVAIFVPAIHLYKQLRGSYGLSRFSAFWRLWVLFAFINIILVLFLQLLVVLGAF